MENSAENWATRILVSMLKENKQKIQRKMFWEFNLIYSNETYLLDIKNIFRNFEKRCKTLKYAPGCELIR